MRTMAWLAAALAAVVATGAVPGLAQESKAPAGESAPARQNAGWRPLFDGSTLAGWKSVKTGGEIPQGIWTASDGVLTVKRGGKAGDIITTQRFSEFELEFEFKMTRGANSGVKYFVQTDAKGGALGLEFQILDDEVHPDGKKGVDGNRTVGAVYDLYPPAKDKKVEPVGQWNHGRVIARGKHVEHWLNGSKVVEFERGSEDFKQHIDASKYKKSAGFGLWNDGHIMLQDHGDEVSYRNIRLRPLEGSSAAK